jgi:hypothetical protein
MTVLLLFPNMSYDCDVLQYLNAKRPCVLISYYCEVRYVYVNCCGTLKQLFMTVICDSSFYSHVPVF